MNIYDEIRAERERQQSMFSDATTTETDWVAFICAYAGRAPQKVVRNVRESQGFRENMVKVAALAVAAIEANDKKSSGGSGA